MKNIAWYDSLNKPFLNPHEWVFTPVWIKNVKLAMKL